MSRQPGVDWEALARREPYFAILANDGGSVGVTGNSEQTEAFFNTGEADVAALLSATSSLLSRELTMTTVLDFGCGAGRLTLPLGRRARQVIGCDIAPTMLSHARLNAERAGLDNISFLLTEQLPELPSGHFDFICSLLVLQYVPPSIGYGLIRALLRLLAPEGVAALEMPLVEGRRSLRRFTHLMRLRSRFGSRKLASHREGMERQPLEVYKYDERKILHNVEAAGARIVARLPTHRGKAGSAVLIVEMR